MPKPKPRNRTPGVYALPGGGFRYMVREPDHEGIERQRWYSLDANGERFVSRKDAHDARIAHLARIASPSLEWSRDSLGAYLETWQRGRRRWGDNTRTGNESIIRVRILPYLGQISLRDLTVVDVEAWHGELATRLAPSTINTTHTLLASALKHAVAIELIPRNVASLVTPPPRDPDIPDPWLPEETRAFLAVSDQHRNASMYRLLLTTGMRLGEVLTIRWRDLDWRGRQVTIQRTMTRRKGQRVIGETTKSAAGRRAIPLTEVTLELLEQHQQRQAFLRRSVGDAWQDNDLVFCSRRGTRLNPSTITEQFERLMQKPRLADGRSPHRIRIHDLRHTAATMMLSAGVPVHIVSKILGHANPAITLKMYAHYIPAYGREAVDDLERLFRSDEVVSPRRLSRP